MIEKGALKNLLIEIKLNMDRRMMGQFKLLFSDFVSRVCIGSHYAR